MAPFHRQLDVVRIVIPPANDDQVLASAGHIQLAIDQATQIAGSQERAFAGIGQMRLKGLRGVVRSVPIALRDGLPCHPDFAHMARFASQTRFRIDDLHPSVVEHAARADEGATRLTSGGGNESALLIRADVGVEQDRVGAGWRVRDAQCRFGQTVAGGQAGPAQAALLERRVEVAQRLRLDWFGGDGGRDPATQIESGSQLRRDFPHTQIVGEVGSLTVRDAVPRDRFEPSHGPLDERQWRHEITGHAEKQRLNQAFDQPVVVMVRHPGRGDAVRRIAFRLAQDAALMQHVAVTDRDPLGRRCRTGRVLQKGDIVGRRLPAVRGFR